MNDTSPAIAEYLRAKMMERSGSERFFTGVNSFNAGRAMALASMPKNLSRAEFRSQYYRRIYGEELPDAAANLSPPPTSQPAVGFNGSAEPLN
jgi:hypothetical protein